MKLTLTLFLTFVATILFAQPSKTEVLTLGTFHFNFPNLDVVQTSKKDQIDVLQPKFQKEIEAIVNKIARFRPTIIVIERPPSRQQQTDSLFNSYLSGNYALRRNEEEQIGFRLAKQLGIQKLYCVDEWGDFSERMKNIVYGRDSLEAKKFENYFEKNPDSLKRFVTTPLFKTKGILAELRQVNDEENIKKAWAIT